MYIIYNTMSLPSFKFTNIIAPTKNEMVNSGLSASSKMEKTGILSSIQEKAQDTFKDVKLPDLSLDTSSLGSGTSGHGDSDGESSFFSFWTLIKLILVALIVWFMWSSLSNNGDFHLGMGEFGDKLNSFFKSMEEKGRELVARVTNQPIPAKDGSADSDSDSDRDSDSEGEGDKGKRRARAPANTRVSSATHIPPTPPAMTNSSDKKPGFINDDTKYTFLDKASRSYTGPAPRADDSTSVTQKHQSGKGGYCYIGEDRGFRSCVKVEAADKCMSGQVFSRQEICVDPTLRE
jgi:hypothetical protein